MNKLLACLGLTVALSLSGCSLYFGDEHHMNDCPPGTYPGYDEWGYEACVAGGGDGWNCSTDNQCASGCYCDESLGTCAEAGYCATDPDCGMGMTCDCSNSCVPAGTETRSCGTSCLETGCPIGTACAADGTCVPVGPSCTNDQQCAAGCYCAGGICVETTVCSTDADCPAGEQCDESRSTCIPGTPPPPPPPPPPPTPLCGGTITCTFGAPTCPAGQVPTILDGCWTGACAALETCTVAPSCAVLNTEAMCLGRTDCNSVYSGQNCTNPNGTACNMGDVGCTCESFTFDRCRAD